jgi:hypothetical protein
MRARAIEHLIKDESYVDHGALSLCTLVLHGGYRITGEGESGGRDAYDQRLARQLARAQAVERLREYEYYHIYRMRQRDEARGV